MLSEAKVRTISVVLFFALCQVIGTMCAVPDLSLADDVAQLAEDMTHMTCPMDGTIMCPPSAMSSPERDVKPGVAVDLDQTPELPAGVVSFSVPQASSPWSWSSASSIVPISIASSSVLRI